MKKIKTFVIMISQHFPKTHKRKGQETGFVEKIISAKKIHTIRHNYPLWKNRMDQVASGDAILSIRVWEGKPYNSKQREVAQITKDHLAGIQLLTSMDYNHIHGINRVYVHYAEFTSVGHDFSTVGKNDGLSKCDFKEWFRNYNGEEMAIIQFTKFRY